MKKEQMGWFFLREGLVKGPVGREKLLEQIKAGQIEDSNMVCREGESYWKCANEFEELSQQFKSVEPPEDWVILRNEAEEYVQRGLFTTREIKDFLRKGVVYPKDLAWRTGMIKWCCLCEIDLFRPTIANKNPLIRKAMEATFEGSDEMVKSFEEFMGEVTNMEIEKDPMDEDRFTNSIVLKPIEGLPAIEGLEALDAEDL